MGLYAFIEKNDNFIFNSFHLLDIKVTVVFWVFFQFIYLLEEFSVIEVSFSLFHFLFISFLVSFSQIIGGAGRCYCCILQKARDNLRSQLLPYIVGHMISDCRKPVWRAVGTSVGWNVWNSFRNNENQWQLQWCDI